MIFKNKVYNTLLHHPDLKDWTMENQLLIDLVEKITVKKDQVYELIERAESEAGEARGDASEARNAAEDAENEADRAEDRCIEARQQLDNLSALLEELSSKLQGEEMSGLDADIARNSANVLKLQKRGASNSRIAKRLSITEVLVDAVIRRNRSEQAEACDG